MTAKLYIGCALTHVPREEFPEYVAFLHALAGQLRTQYEVKYALVNSDPQLENVPPNERARSCYEWDKKMVEECDLLVAEVSYPSLGLGIELQVAAERQIPAILCFQSIQNHRAKSTEYDNPDAQRHSLQIGDGFVSLMALGLPNVVETIAYPNYDTGLAKIAQAVKQYSASPIAPPESPPTKTP